MGRVTWLSKDKASPILNLATGNQVVMKKGPGAALQAAEALGKKKKSGAWHAHLCVGMGVGGGATTCTCALRDVPCLLL